MKILFVAVLLILSFQVSFGQKPLKAELFDAFPGDNCDSLKMRTVNFLENVLIEPGAVAYVVIHEAKNSPQKGNTYEKIIIDSKYMYGRWGGYDKNKDLLKIVYGEKRDEFEVVFWKVPNGAEKPHYLREGSLYSIPNSDKPFIFAFTYTHYLANDGCPDFNEEIFVQALKSNQNLTGHILIFNLPTKFVKKEEAAQYWRKLLSVEQKIPRQRFKIFFINDKKKHGLGVIEFWLVPIKKSH